MTRLFCLRCQNWLPAWQVTDGYHDSRSARIIDGSRIEFYVVRCGPVAEDVAVSGVYL